jgi:glutathione-regulated potassium-efflux system ancillary protein KefC
MTAVWTLFTLWVALALIASLLSVWLRVSTALTEICVGTAAQLILGTAFGATVLDPMSLGSNSWRASARSC